MESANYEDGPQGRGYTVRSLKRANRSASQAADCCGNSVMFSMVVPAMFNESNSRLSRAFRSASQAADCCGNSVMFSMVVPAMFNESNSRLSRAFFIGGLADS